MLGAHAKDPATKVAGSFIDRQIAGSVESRLASPVPADGRVRPVAVIRTLGKLTFDAAGQTHPGHCPLRTGHE